MTPRPPALETAEASGAVEVWAMPARRIGWRMERRVVRGVVIVGTEEDEAIVVVGGIAMSVEDGGGFVRSGRISNWPWGSTQTFEELLVDSDTKSWISSLKDDFHHLWSVYK